MSTASLHCGIVCCARGFWCHAPKGSGVSGATRAHYDARALEWAVRPCVSGVRTKGQRTARDAEVSIQKLKSQRLRALASRLTSILLARGQGSGFPLQIFKVNPMNSS